MKGIILRLALALAALTVVPNALAADADGGNAFLDAKWGKTFGKLVNNDSSYANNSPSSWGVDGGYRGHLDDTHLVGFDVGYMHFGDIAHQYGGNSLFSGELSATAISLGGHLQFLFGDQNAWRFQVRAGLLSAKFDESFTSFTSPTTGSDSWRQSGTYLGFGIGRNVTQDVSLMLAYNLYSLNDAQYQFGQHPALMLNWIGLEAEYRF